MNLVSIVIPTYNRAERLRKAIKSCLEQTYKNIEIIIVDDGSKDHTKKVVEEFSHYKNICYIYKENGGLPAALNDGFKISQGQYLTWTSDDNVFLESAIEEMVNTLKSVKKPAFVYSDYYKYEEENELKYHVNLNCLNRVYLGNYIGACFMYDRRVYEDVGEYDETVRLAEDYDYWIRIYEKYPMIHIPKVLYVYSFHSNTLTSTRLMEVKKMLSKVSKKHSCFEKAMIEVRELSKDRPIFIWGIGEFGQRVYKEFTRELNIEGFVDSLIDYPDVLFNKPIYNPSQLNYFDSKKPYIIISSTYRSEIEAELNKMGFISEKDYY